MIPLSTMTTFAGMTLLLALVPGPDNLFVITQSAVRGGRTGLFLTLGLCTGLVIYSFAVAFGFAAIIQTAPVAFTVLKTLGALYLLYLAYMAFRARHGPAGVALDVSDDDSRAYCRGVAMNLANPKIAIFFLALLPQFTSPAWGSMTLQLLSLGGLFILCSFVVFACLAMLASSFGAFLRRSERSQLLLNRATGVVFVGLAIKLATVH